MQVLYDAAGNTCWLTVRESEMTRYLELDGCEEGAMYRDSEHPVFRYLWFHECSCLAARPRRLLVLGAGAFTAPKCLALAYPEASVDTVDIEPDLEPIARRFFRLEQTCFSRIAFHGMPAETFLERATPPYDFIFDDLFDGFQHVPNPSRTRPHFEQARRVLGEEAIFMKNIIWSPSSAATRAACEEAQQILVDVFPGHLILALGKPDIGHNRLLIGSTGRTPPKWKDLRARLASSIPASFLDAAIPIV